MRCVYLLFFYSFCFADIAQQDVPLGTWRSHLTYHDARKITIADNIIYCSSGNGLFTLDISEGLLQTITKIDGLSDVRITDLYYHREFQTLIITYETGNIDLIKPEQVVNIRSILNAPINNKKINSIFVDGSFVYLSTDFGLVRLDIVNEQIRETYTNIAPGGTPVRVAQAAVLGDSIFLATNIGLLRASLDPSVNLLDFANWQLTTVNNAPISHIAALGSKLFFTIDDDSLYHYFDHQIEGLAIAPSKNYRNLEAATEQLILSTVDTIYCINSDLSYTTISGLPFPNDVIFLDMQNIWVADEASGLVNINNGERQAYFPSGVYDQSVFRLAYFQNKLLAISGGYNLSNYTAQNNLSGFYVFENGVWTNYTAEDNEINARVIPTLSDLNTVALGMDTTVYIGSFQDGLLAWNTISNTFDSLINIPLSSNTANTARVSGLAFDAEGNLWVSNHGVSSGQSAIHRLERSTNIWTSFSFNGVNNPLDILIDAFDYKWLRLSPNLGGGIFVFDNDGRQRMLSEAAGQGVLPDNNVYSMAIDNDNVVWLGTGAGLITFFNANDILEGTPVEGILPRFEGRPLLNDEKITAIAVDGGNRKWIGSENGVWLFSADGSEQILHFTEENSPLIANTIIDIEVHELTGEVFFATNKGIVSYRGTATTGANNYATVKVFPNPVYPGFSGLVSISGLIAGSEVKITDISGQLIWQTFSEGGTATWNVRDYNGRRAKTGIYLIFLSTTDGRTGLVAKIAVLE